MDDLTRYLDGLQRSWEPLCAPERGGRLVRTDALLAASSPYAFLNNGVLLHPSALAELCDFYRDVDSFAVWTGHGDDAALRAAGFTPDVTTRPMLCDRDALPTDADRTGIEHDVAAVRVASLNGVPAQVLEDVPGVRCFGTTGGECGLVLQEAGDDVVMSFVATQPSARGRGLATRLVTAALAEARERGAAGVLLQATPQAEQIYRRLGFRGFGGWQEWTRARRPTDAPAPGPSGGGPSA